MIDVVASSGAEADADAVAEADAVAVADAVAEAEADAVADAIGTSASFAVAAGRLHPTNIVTSANPYVVRDHIRPSSHGTRVP